MFAVGWSLERHMCYADGIEFPEIILLSENGHCLMQSCVCEQTFAASSFSLPLIIQPLSVSLSLDVSTFDHGQIILFISVRLHGVVGNSVEVAVSFG